MSDIHRENRLQMARHREQFQAQFRIIGKLPAALCLALLVVSGFAHADDSSLIREANAALSQKDYNGAFSKFSVLAEHGNASAQFNLGAFFLNGQGVQRDEKQAYEWFSKSAAQGNARALQILQNAAAKGNENAKNELNKIQPQKPSPAPAPAPVPVSKPEVKTKASTTAAAPRARPKRSSESASSDFSLGVNLGSTGKITGISNSSSFGLLGGYKFNSNFGVELAYNQLYRNANADQWLSAMYPGTTGTFDMTSISVAGQYTYGLTTNLSLLGNLGFHNSSYKVKSSGYGSTTGTSSGLVVGIKAQYDLSESIGVRGGFDIYTLSGGMTGRIAEVGMAVVTKF